MEIEVADPWFSLLQKGIKTVEGRKGNPKWKALSEGDAVIFSANDGRRVHAIRTVEEGAAVYWQWWSPEEVDLFGVLAIEVKIR